MVTDSVDSFVRQDVALAEKVIADDDTVDAYFDKVKQALIRRIADDPAEGGTALAEVLSGRVNPSGRLPVTFYRSADDLPPFEDYAMAGRTYRFFGGEVLHPFGFGLSYKEFRYSGLSVPGRIAAGEPLKVAVGVENTGKRAGETVVQLYVAALNPPTRAPQKQLAAVKRISLKPGETRQVELEVKPESFLLTFDDGERKLLPGAWRIEVGHDSRRSAATTEIELI